MDVPLLMSKFIVLFAYMHMTLIVLSAPSCDIPFASSLPTDGALICAQAGDTEHAKVCRIHCRQGYQLRYLDDDHQFTCGWDGQWSVEAAWPKCVSKSWTPIDKLPIKYPVSCMDTSNRPNVRVQ